MSTSIRSELSTDNRYYIPKHRYYELLHFCRQYPEWQSEAQTLEETLYPKQVYYSVETASKNTSYSITEDSAMRLNALHKKIELVESTAIAVDAALSPYILQGVTVGTSYAKLSLAKDSIPCSKGTYYDRYRRFFWLLDKLRD